MFTLHPRLAADTLHLADLPLCRVLLMNDMHYPWLILVPRRRGIREIYELNAEDQQQLMRESTLVSQRMASCFQAYKMNIAALGNMVPQLHVHHIVRYENDAAWPAPVWGKHPPLSYEPEMLPLMVAKIREALMDADLSPIEWAMSGND